MAAARPLILSHALLPCDRSRIGFSSPMQQIGKKKNTQRLFALPIGKSNGLEDERSRLELVLSSNSEKEVACSRCKTAGNVQCLTCSGSGLYLDAILESQGIKCKVKCMGCGGTGNILCPKCGGRGHV